MAHSRRYLSCMSAAEDQRLNEFLNDTSANPAHLFRQIAVGLARVLVGRHMGQQPIATTNSSADIRHTADALLELLYGPPMAIPTTADGQLQAGAELDRHFQSVLCYMAESGSLPMIDTTWTIDLCCQELDDCWQRGQNIFGSLTRGLWMLYGSGEKRAYYPTCPFCHHPFPIPDGAQKISDVPPSLRRMYEFKSLADVAELNNDLRQART